MPAIASATIKATTLTGTLSTADQPNVTSLGTQVSLTVSGLTAITRSSNLALTVERTGTNGNIATFTYGANVFSIADTGGFSAAGASTIGGALTYGGVTLSNAVTGTGNMVLSASPTFTGTVTAAAITPTSVTTAASSVSANNATATTLFAVPATAGLLHVYVWTSGQGDAYTATATIVQSGAGGASPALLVNQAGAGVTLSLSGSNLQVTQTSGGIATVNYGYLKV